MNQNHMIRKYQSLARHANKRPGSESIWIKATRRMSTSCSSSTLACKSVACARIFDLLSGRANNNVDQNMKSVLLSCIERWKLSVFVIQIHWIFTSPPFDKTRNRFTSTQYRANSADCAHVFLFSVAIVSARVFSLQFSHKMKINFMLFN